MRQARFRLRTLMLAVAAVAVLIAVRRWVVFFAGPPVLALGWLLCYHIQAICRSMRKRRPHPTEPF